MKGSCLQLVSSMVLLKAGTNWCQYSGIYYTTWFTTMWWCHSCITVYSWGWYCRIDDISLKTDISSWHPRCWGGQENQTECGAERLQQCFTRNKGKHEFIPLQKVSWPIICLQNFSAIHTAYMEKLKKLRDSKPSTPIPSAAPLLGLLPPFLCSRYVLRCSLMAQTWKLQSNNLVSG